MSVKRIVASVLVVLALAPLAGQAQTNDALEMARGHLRSALGNAPRDARMLRGLEATKDPQLRPLLEAMSASGDRLRRLFAVMSLSQQYQADVNARMAEVLAGDADAGIRSVALAHLIEHDAATDAQLALAAQASHEGLALLAARELAQRGDRQRARAALTPLAQRGAQEVQPLAQTILLSADDYQHLDALQARLRDPAEAPERTMLLLSVIEKDHIQAAGPLVRAALEAQANPRVRIQALRALAAIAPTEGADALVAALRAAQQPADQRYLMDALAEGPQPQGHWQALQSDAPVPVIQMAVLEQAHRTGDAFLLTESARALLQAGHPVHVDFVLRRAREGRQAAYVQPLLEYIFGLPTASSQMGPAHELGARAAGVLAQIGSPEALEGLQALLAGPYNARVRTVAAGLAATEGPVAPELVGPLLQSPYDELAVDAAMALAKAGDTRAVPVLERVVTHAQRYPPPLVAMASWYLLRLAGQAEPLVAELTEQVR